MNKSEEFCTLVGQVKHSAAMSLSDLTDSNPDLLDNGDFSHYDCGRDEVDEAVVHTLGRKVRDAVF